MHRSTRDMMCRTPWGRSFCQLGAVLALLVLPLLLSTGCGEEESKRFREAAIPALEAGFNSVADGLLDGFFELNTPRNTDSTGDGTTTQ